MGLYLPIDGMEEADEVVDRRAESGAEFGGELPKELGDKIRVII